MDVIFGIPGGALIPVHDVLYDSDTKHVLMRHEDTKKWNLKKYVCDT